MLWLKARKFEDEAALLEMNNFAAEIDGRLLLRLGQHQLASLGKYRYATGTMY